MLSSGHSKSSTRRIRVPAELLCALDTGTPGPSVFLIFVSSPSRAKRKQQTTRKRRCRSRPYGNCSAKLDFAEVDQASLPICPNILLCVHQINNPPVEPMSDLTQHMRKAMREAVTRTPSSVFWGYRKQGWTRHFLFYIPYWTVKERIRGH